MKQYYRLSSLASLFLMLLSVNLMAQAPNCTYGPELRFNTYQLVSGTHKAVGATYRYSNVLDSVDALITIAAAQNATLIELDITSTGTDSAFQPQVRINNQPSYGATAYMDFQINFVKAGTFEPTSITAWKATAVDVDGDSYRLRESVGFNVMDSYILENYSNLNTNFSETGVIIFEAGSVANQPGITVTATEHMVTAEYYNRSSFLYRTRIIANPHKDGPSNANERMFSLNFNPCLINNYTDPDNFPVEWLGFDGRVSAEQVELKWSTASELNNDHFEIQRAVDGETFETIGTLNGQGTTQVKSDYSFTDYNPANGINYYRLKQVDFDGQFAYSEVLSLRVIPNGFRFTLYPNPASDYLRISTNQEEIVSISLLDLSGRELAVPRTAMDAYQWELSVSHLQAGTYLVRIETENSHNAPQKIVIY